MQVKLNSCLVCVCKTPKVRICTKTFVHYCSLVRNEKLHADSNVENLQ